LLEKELNAKECLLCKSRHQSLAIVPDVRIFGSEQAETGRVYTASITD
jgi:hypothetical protein